MKTILVDPYPRKMELIFTPQKIQVLKKKLQFDKCTKKKSSSIL